MCHILAFKSRIRSFGSTGVQFCTLLVVCCSLPWRLSTRHSDMWQNYKTKPFRDEFIIRGRNRAKRLSVRRCKFYLLICYDPTWMISRIYIHTSLFSKRNFLLQTARLYSAPQKKIENENGLITYFDACSHKTRSLNCSSTAL